MSKVCAIYHIVISTKNRRPTISNEYRRYLYEFIYKILIEHKCFTYQIGGVQNHIHILIGLSPNIALAALMREIKSRSSGWLAKKGEFPDFRGWSKGYYASTISYEERVNVINYIKSQQTHHNVVDFDNELNEMCRRCDMEIILDDLR